VSEYRIGQRVRILDPGACDYWIHQDHSYEIGSTGEITEIKPAEPNDGHIYQVQFDDPRPHPPGQMYPRLCNSIYAPHELEPAS
jgi:hypothetical protein